MFVVMAYTAMFNIDGRSRNKVKADTGMVNLSVVNGKIIPKDSTKRKPTVVYIQFDGRTFYMGDDHKVYYLSARGEKNYIQKLQSPTK